MSYEFELHYVPAPNTGAGRHDRPLLVVDTLIFHRINVGDDAAAVAEFFAAEGPKWIGTTDMPYTFIVPAKQPAGNLVVVEQAVPLSIKTPHACAWNRKSVGVGVVGDFRQHAPTDKQRAACVWLAQRLSDRLPRVHRGVAPLLVTMHSALGTATHDPAKLAGGSEECPGPLFVPTWREARLAAARGDFIRSAVSAAGKEE